jgi:hypothetical protein
VETLNEMQLTALLLAHEIVTVTEKPNFDLLLALFELGWVLNGSAVELMEQSVVPSVVESHDGSLVQPIHNLDHPKLVQRA